MTAGVDASITAIVRPDGSVRVLYAYGDVVLDKVYNRADIDAFREKHSHGGDVPRAIAGISLETERLMKSQLDSWVANLAPEPGMFGWARGICARYSTKEVLRGLWRRRA